MAEIYASAEAVSKAVEGAENAGTFAVLVDNLVCTSALGSDVGAVQTARAAVRNLAVQRGCGPASIQALYEAKGRGEATGFTVPAINIRALTYDVAQSIFQVLKKIDGGPVLFEIARSEVDYTMQRPAEYATSVLAAALRCGWQGPVMIQGDHFQIKASAFHKDRQKEVGSVKELIREAIEAGFYNIDIDTSTLVDLSFADVNEQQRLNYEIGAELTAYLRSIEPAGVTVSVGGEIGEVGKQNSSPQELRAYMDGLNKLLGSTKGISKISVQTGTSHGGIPLPDGSVAEVALDLSRLGELSRIAREEYGMSGAVQHGASTLPDEVFHKFVDETTSEIHLATGFQNMIYDSAAFPADLKEKIYTWLSVNCADEHKPGKTEAQFLYSSRKKGFGPFKKELWNMDGRIRASIMRELADKFEYLFRQLGVAGTRAVLRTHIG